MDRVFLGIPTGSRAIDLGTASAILGNGYPSLTICFKSHSLLPRCFNLLLSDAWNQQADSGLTHFCLLHSDCDPERGWLGRMMQIMQARGLDALSALVPQKSDSGVTSTALERPEDPWNPRRLTMKECQRLPPTFGPADCVREFGTGSLLFNTGVLLLRMAAINPERHFFEFKDQLVKRNGKYLAQCRPEDWEFSRKILADGLNYAVTREIRVTHWGSAGWDNQSVWGCETDTFKAG